MTNVIEMAAFESRKRIERMRRMAAFFDLTPERQPDGRWLLMPQQGSPPFDDEARTIGETIDRLDAMLRDCRNNTSGSTHFPSVAMQSEGDLRHFRVEIWWNTYELEIVAEGLDPEAAVALVKAEGARLEEIRLKHIEETLV